MGKAGRGKAKYRSARGRQPRGGDGHGEFKVTPMSAYRTQPLAEMLTSPGITVTCVQGKEQIAEQEMLDALELAADDLYPETGAGAQDDDGGDDDDDGDIEDMLKRELENLAAAPGKKSARFRLCKREAACVAYINVLPPLDPVRLVKHIIEQCERTARCSFRFTQRLTPIVATCSANLDKLAEMARQVVPPAFETPDNRGLKFAVTTNSRNSSALERMDMIKTVAEVVTSLSPEHTVDIKNADRTVMIELHKHSVGISVVQDWDRYRRFNPAAVARDAAKAKGVETGRVGTKVETVEEGEPKTTGQKAAENRARRAEGVKAAQESGSATPAKRKVSEEKEEDGELPRADDVEFGEVVEDPHTKLGDDFEEVMEGGRAVKVRRHE